MTKSKVVADDEIVAFSGVEGVATLNFACCFPFLSSSVLNYLKRCFSLDH